MHRFMLFVALVLTAGVLGQTASPAEAAKKKKADLPAIAYVNDGGEQVYAFRINSDLTLTELDDSPFATNAGSASSCTVNCQTIAYSSDRHLLFVGTADGIDVFSVATDGSLTLNGDGPFGGTEIVGVATAFHDKTLFVYGAARDDDEVLAFQADNDGDLTELGGSPYAVGDKPEGISATVDFLFVANSGPHSISSFQLNKNGTLTKVRTSPVTIDAGANDVESVFSLDIKSKYAVSYVGTSDDSELTGTLSSTRQKAPTQVVGTSPYDTDLSNTSGGLTLTKDLVFAIEGGGSDVQALGRNSGNELSKLGGAQDSGVSDAAVGDIADKGNLLVIVDSSNGEVVLNSVNTDNGEISEQDLLSVGTGFSNPANGIVIAKP